jgi:conjugative relaxase-like TrwC/TraI family protein
MLVSITPLGSSDRDPGRAAIQVVRYVESKIQAARRIEPDRAGGVEAYYADSVEGPGWWLGSGTSGLGLAGQVQTEQLRRVLLGEHPGTGDARAPTRTPGGPSRAYTSAGPETTSGELTLAEAARVSGVSDRYLRRVAARTERELGTRVGELLVGRPLAAVSKTFLLARRDPERGWVVERAELDRFVATRKPARTLIGYDVTFSCPKSVSILWATASPHERVEIIAAVDAAVDAGLRYLESVTSTRNPNRPHIQGLVAAAFTHGTSRNLDPQLHVHAVVAKLVQALDGEMRPLDGRDLFAHAKTAGYLAAAELRHETARRLGWEWGRVVHGLADVVGVPVTAIREMSSRQAQIESLTAEMGVHTAASRQVAAYRTRTAKAAVAPSELRAEWDRRLTESGFDAAERAACVGRQLEIPILTEPDGHALKAHLASASGVTERSSVFDRRDVIQAVAAWANDRAPADEILDLADDFLASQHAVPLAAYEHGAKTDVIRINGAHTVPVARGLTRYSTPAMLRAEQNVLEAFRTGLDRGVGIVSDGLIEAAIARRPSLGDDQAAMVRAICGSGDQFQCVLGPAGSGKTFALDAARDAWQEAGYTVVGAADQGTAAEALGRGARIRSETLEYWLTVLDTHAEPAQVLGPRTVMLVDEASAAGTRSLARLFAHARRNGAVVRLVGDPAQHSAVTAGGAFRELTGIYADRTPALSELRRQRGPHLRELRLALGEYREGLITEAMDRLARDDRVVLADTADELLDKLATDWWLDRQTRRANPEQLPSSMVAEHHRERRALNTRARVMLEAAGELTGPALVAGSYEFRAGDEVICRTAAKHLHPPGVPHRYLRNGTRGTVVAVDPAESSGRAGVVVAFEDRDPIRVPLEFLTRELRPGIVGGLTYSYALTSHAAQGQTYEAARTLATDGSTRPAIYVGLTRGRDDARVYAVRRRELLADRESEDHMPRLDDHKTTLEAITDRLTSTGDESLATTRDPHALDVAVSSTTHSLAQLVELHQATADTAQRRLLARAVRAQHNAIALRALPRPDPALVARIGERPYAEPDRHAWDAAVAVHAIHDALRELDPEKVRGLQLLDAARVTRLVRDAEIAFLARQPTAQLATEARELADDLARSESRNGRSEHHLLEALTRAAHTLTEARRVEAEALARLAAPQRGVSPITHEHARRALESARRRTAAAALHRDRLRERADMLRDRLPAHQPALQERVECLDAALERQVEAAVARAQTVPPEYITQLLGPRPTHERATTWDARVRQLERYRHQHGHSPRDSMALDTAPLIDQVLGPPPADSARLLAWRATAATLTAARGVSPEP